LKKWFEKNSDVAYPSKVTNEFLAKKSNLIIKQVSNWFLNERKKNRYKPFLSVLGIPETFVFFSFFEAFLIYISN
jgi:hypothetical protein